MTPSNLVDKALADAEAAGGIPAVSGRKLRDDADSAIKNNLTILPADYPQSVDDVAQVEYCTSGRAPGIPSQDTDLVRSLNCADTATWAYLAWTLTGSDDFITAFYDAVYFLENNASPSYVADGIERIRRYTLP